MESRKKGSTKTKSISSELNTQTHADFRKGDNKSHASHSIVSQKKKSGSGEKKCRRKAPNKSSALHHQKMNVKNKKVKNYSKESNSKHLSQMKIENTESERAPVVFCKRGAKRKQIIDQDSDQFSQAKQSLLEAKEPDPDVLSKNSYLFSHELSSDGNTSALKPKDFGISEIVNVHTKSGGKFSKTASLKKSTFLGEEEEADLMNVNEFDTYEDYYDNRLVKIGKLAGHGRVLKTLPITKESFLNWQKQSILKSFATSQEASFVSNRPTERIEPDKIMNEVINPSRLLESEKKRFKNDIIQNNSRKPTNYKQLAAEGSSPGQFSTPYLDESSIFEECHHDSGYREPSHSSMRRVEEIKEQRKGKLHNCNKVHDYNFLKAHEPKDSVAITSNSGDNGLFMKETMDCIETYEEFESPEISDGEAQNTPIFTNTEQERSFAKNDLLKNITEEKLSDIVSTPEREKFGNPKNYSTEMVRIESSEQRSNKSIDLNNLVTKVNIGLPFVPNKKDECIPEAMVHEQGQNSVEEDKQPSIKNLKQNEDRDAQITKYVEKDITNSIGSINKSDVSIDNSCDDSQKLEEGEGEEHQSELHKAHLIQTLQAIQYIRTLDNHFDLEGKYLELPPHPMFKSPETTKTIIFDLDETLVHCVDEPETDNPHVVLKVTFPTGETVDAGINIRPYAIECLKEANKYFQVVVFTASHQSYADVVLDYLDPNRELIQHRLYRNSCVQTKEGVYIKDLRIIVNRSMENICIVDNAVYSFGFQLDNGIPIIPFYDDPNDEELHHLVFYMKCLSQLEDMRVQNCNAFQLSGLDSAFIEKYLEGYYSKLRDEEAHEIHEGYDEQEEY